MFFKGIMMVLVVIPLVLLIWSMIDVKKGKREKVNWKLPSIIFIVLLLGTLIGDIYLSNEYSLPIFPNIHDNIIALIVIGILFGIMAIINIFVSISMKGAPKTVHDGKKMWKVIGIGAAYFTVIFLWFIPLAGKTAYVVDLNTAVSAEDKEGDRDFTLVLVKSEGDCLTVRNCSDENFNNVFYLKNNTDSEKEVQVKVRALNEEKQEIEIIDSLIMKIDSGKMKMVKTEETDEDTSIWDRHSFETDVRVEYFQYKIRMREID
ncbi:hypothetical protein LG329_17790 [Virgibacillus necropolis]|uniref:hypothetical protein n=1 Tax=Virgibacillus necropolis TaxID=163877 RepID=UPI00384E225E